MKRYVSYAFVFSLVFAFSFKLAISLFKVLRQRVQTRSLPPSMRRVCRLGNFLCFVVGFRLPRSNLRGVTDIDPLPQRSQILAIEE